MRIRFDLLSFLICLIYLPGKTHACGSSADAAHHYRFHHHTHSAPSHSKHFFSSNHPHLENSGSENSDQKDDNHCHCPGCGGQCSGNSVFGGLIQTLQPGLAICPSTYGSKRLAFYYAKHLPEEICFPIWQPPKIYSR